MCVCVFFRVFALLLGQRFLDCVWCRCNSNRFLVLDPPLIAAIGWCFHWLMIYTSRPRSHTHARMKKYVQWFWSNCLSYSDLLNHLNNFYESLNECWQFICICWPSVSVNRRRWESTESRLAGALLHKSAGEHWGKRFGPNKASRTTKPCYFVWVMLSVEQTRIGLLFSIWNKDQTREWLGVVHSPFFSAQWVESIEFDFGIIKLWVSNKHEVHGHFEGFPAFLSRIVGLFGLVRLVLFHEPLKYVEGERLWTTNLKFTKVPFEDGQFGSNKIAIL